MWLIQALYSNLALILVDLDLKLSSRAALLDRVKETVIVCDQETDKVVYYNAAANSDEKYFTN